MNAGLSSCGQCPGCSAACPEGTLATPQLWLTLSPSLAELLRTKGERGAQGGFILTPTPCPPKTFSPACGHCLSGPPHLRPAHLPWSPLPLHPPLVQWERAPCQASLGSDSPVRPSAGLSPRAPAAAPPLSPIMLSQTLSPDTEHSVRLRCGHHEDGRQPVGHAGLPSARSTACMALSQL